jgi:hypothetical protein
VFTIGAALAARSLFGWINGIASVVQAMRRRL